MNEWGEWDATRPGASLRGYHINQFNSPTMPLEDIMGGYFNGQKDQKVLKSFHNQSLGEPFAAAGDKWTVELLDKCIDPAHTIGGIPRGPVFLGIDVGHDEIYVTACYMNRYGQRCLWNMWHIKDRPGKTAWEILEDTILNKLSAWVAVCDAHPDKRGANALSIKYHGRFFMGFEKDRPEQEETAKFDKVVRGEATRVVIDRTMAFDQTINDAMKGLFVLPRGAREMGEVMPRRDYNGYYSHMIQMVRVITEDAKGRDTAQWVKSNRPDHWHHSDMFCHIASKVKPRLTVPVNMQKAFAAAGNPVAA